MSWRDYHKMLFGRKDKQTIYSLSFPIIVMWTSSIQMVKYR